MGNKVTFVIIAQDRFNRVLREASRIAKNFQGRLHGLGLAATRAGERFAAMAKKTKELRSRAKEVGGTLSKYVTLPIVGAGIAALHQSAKFEQLGISFAVLTGSAEKGKKVMEDITKFSATTPFQLGDIADSAKVLLSFGVSGEKVTGVLRQLGDIAAGTGKPLGEFALIYGKILAKGKVTGEEMQQLAEKGISLQTILAKKYNTSGQVIMAAMAKGQISAKMFTDALAGMTGKGGKFYGMTKRLSTSLGGLWSTTLDNITLLLRDVGDTLVHTLDVKAILRSMIKWLGKAGAAFKSFASAHPTLLKVALALTAIAAVLGPLLLLFGPLLLLFGSLLAILPMMSAGFGMLGTAITVATGPIGIIIAGIAAAIAAMIYLYNTSDTLRAVFDALGRVIAGVFGFTFFSIKILVKGIWKLVKGLLDGIGTVFDTIGGWLGFGGNIDVASSSKTDININVKAPAGAVGSVKASTKSSGAGPNIGVNMVPAGP